MTEASVPLFPLPRRLNSGRKHWALSELVIFEHEVAGLPPPEPIDPAKEVYLPTSKVKERYNVSDMWLHRRTVETKAARAALTKQSA
jgi:hypothetical protein